MTRTLLHREQELEVFLKQQDIASWVRSMSNSQMQAIQTLHLSIRDDVEQGTCYRVHKCLARLGIEPLIDSHGLRIYIKLCRQSDLALLYFLLESHYKTAQKNAYTDNEKLLMTAIMILDLEFTLQALDDLLPAQRPKPQKLSLTAHRDKALARVQSNNVFKYKRAIVCSPYFQRQRRPIERRLNFKCSKPLYTVSFPFWKVGEQPNYAIKTDTRWFAEYELKPSLRLVKQTVDHAIDALLTNEQMPFSKEGNQCLYHSFLIKEAQLVSDALKVAARDRCLTLIDTTAMANKRRRQHIVQQLEEDIDWYAGKYKRLANLQLTPVQQVLNCQGDCDTCQSLVRSWAQPHEARQLFGEDDVQRIANDATGSVKIISGAAKLQDTHCDPTTDVKRPTFKQMAQHIISQCGARTLQRLTSVLMHDPCCAPNKQPTDNRNCFTAPTANTPYAFDAQQVFALNVTEEVQQQRKIRRLCVKALHELPAAVATNEPKSSFELCFQSFAPRTSSVKDIVQRVLVRSAMGGAPQLDSRSADMLGDDKVNVVQEVVNCAKTIWLHKLQAARAQNRRQTNDNNTNKISPLEYPDVQYFNPDDNVLMDRLLKDGLAILRKDKRFVFATFPDSHKLQTMREWIKRRYGKRYTHKDVLRTFNESFGIFQALLALQNGKLNLGRPSFCRKRYSYDEYHKVWRRAAGIRRNFHRILSSRLTQHTTYCWFAMGGLMVPSGPPTDTFYAYMPANATEILWQHPWNGECRDMKTHHIKRQQALRQIL